MGAISLARRFDPTLRSLVMMAALAPLAITRSIEQPMWDDAYFLDRAVCVNRAAYALSAHEVWRCVGNMFKSPIMALLLLPAGPLTHGIEQLGVATFILASCTLTLAALLGWITSRSGAPFWTVAVAAVAIAFCNPIQNAGAPFMVDGSFAILVAVTLQLPLLELGASTPPGWSAARRGLLWGAVLGLGLLAKLTFCLFAVLTAPLILLASLRQSGVRATRDKLMAALAASLLPVVIFVQFSSLYLGHGYQAAFGESAAQYGPALSFWKALVERVASAGDVYWLICASLLVWATVTIRRNPDRVATALATCCILLAYLLIASFSRNEDPRFLWCVWVGLPLSAVCAVSGGKSAAASRDRIASSLICAVIVVVSAPMLSRFDLQKVREAEQLLRSLKLDGPIRIEIASDPRILNINTFQLARQIAWDDLRNVDVTTVVYNKISGQSTQFSLEQLRTADFVIFPGSISKPTGPSFTNSLTPRFLDFARACGRSMKIDAGFSDVLAFDMRKTGCGASDATPKQ